MASLLAVALVVLVLPSFSVARLPENTKYMGCYEDVSRNNRAFQDLFYNARPSLDWTRWKDLSYIVAICAQRLIKDNPKEAVLVFSVQDWGECRIDADQTRYKDFKKSSNCLSHVGGPWANAVYEINRTQEVNCNIKDPLYVNGRTRYFPNGPAECRACKCIKGKSDCETITCDNHFKCEKYLPPAEGACCSKCACYHLGKTKLNGEEWDDRRVNGTCNQCRCINGEASCTKTSCSGDCYRPENIPGKCCPRCTPRAPTTSPWEFITQPTTRPKATLPPWMKLPPGFGKRSLRKKRSKKAKTFAKL